VLTEAQTARDAALAPKVGAFVDAFSNMGPFLLKDGRVVFTSNRDGIPAIYVADTKNPAAAPKKLPTGDERVASVEVLPDERTVLFTSDVNSDENFSVFRIELDGTGLKNLTPDPKIHRNPPTVARDKNGLFAYSAHAATDRTAHVFVQNADGTPPREVAQDPVGGIAGGMSADGARVLFKRFVSESEQILFSVDIASGRPKRVFPAEGTANITTAALTADGAGLYVATQSPSSPPRLVLIDVQTQQERAHYEDRALPHGAIEAIGVPPKGDRIALTVDAGNRSEVRILDAKTLAIGATAKIGPGSARFPRFRADGALFGLTLLRPDAPADIVAIDPKSGNVTPLRSDPRPGIAAIPKLTAKIDAIKAFDGLSIPVNVYLPATAKSSKLPALVLIHGGPSGSAYLHWTPTIGFFTAMGFAVVEPNIRGSDGFGPDFEKADDREKRGDALKDVESVNTWVRAQAWCDPDKIAIGGISYGGYMTLLALTRQPKLWRAGIDGSGMSDLRTMEKLEDQTIRAYDETEFGKIGKDDAVLAEWSPLKDAANIASPLFVYQGVHDPVTPQNEADQIVAAVRKSKVPVEYMLVENEGHGIVRRANWIAYLARSYRFLSEHMGLAPPPP
jgi:dipeptidyl aminopeptidase/acylaminoacyl peptidase